MAATDSAAEAKRTASALVEEMLARTGWTPSRLAREAGLAHTTVTRILDVESEHAPNINTLLKLGTAAGLDIARLTEALQADTLGIRNVPVISWVKAGEMAETSDPYHPGHVEDTVPVTYACETLIALHVDGGSIDRVAPEGSIIVIDYSDKILVDKKFYVFRLNDQTTVKRYRSAPDRLEPFSTDPAFETLFPQAGLEVVGRVVQVIQEL